MPFRHLAAALALLVAGVAPALAQPAIFAESTTEGVGEGRIWTQDAVWGAAGGSEMLARIYRPTADAPPASVVVDVHGGAWSSLDRTAGEVYAKALARRGHVVVSIDYRQGPDHKHPAASADVAAALRWAKLHAAAFGVSPERVGVIGSSSGGHLALLAALAGEDPDHAGTLIRHADDSFAPRPAVSSRPAFIVAMWPPNDPLARRSYAERAGLDRLVAATDAYFPDEAAMRDASVPARLAAGGGGRDGPPPLLLVHSGRDGNVPDELALDLVESWQDAGGALEYLYFPDQPHAFGHQASPATDQLVAAVDAFIRRRGAE
jgi:acetyl esterase/lipase